MKKIYCVIFLIGLTALPISNLVAQNYSDSLDAELTYLSDQYNIPGMYVVIMDKNKILYQRGFGYSNLQTHRPFTAETIENIGSVSKTFIAVALMKAVELNYFTLETDINDILPFQVLNPFFPEEIIKVKDLATHTSGIVDNESIYPRSYKFIKTDSTDKRAITILDELGYTGGLQYSTLSAFLQSYLSKEGFLYNNHNFSDSKPEEQYHYSNIGSALAAYLIEIKSGLSFSDFTQQHILKPLEMDHSSWFLEEIPMDNHAIPYLNKDVAFPFYSLTTYPDGGLRTSASDLSKYVFEMIRGFNGQSSLLSQASFEKMIHPAFSDENTPDNFNLADRNKGVFWNLYPNGYIGHDGDDPGVSTNLLFNQTRGIIFMANIYLDDRSKFLETLEKYATKLN